MRTMRMKRYGMSTIKHLIILAIALSFVFIYTPATTYACSCIEPSPVLEELERSSTVFSGKVLQITDMNEGNEIISSGDPIAVLFEVKTTWKGSSEAEVLLYTARGSETCGFQFNTNEEYLVYAFNTAEGELQTNICTRTTFLSNAHVDLAALGEGKQSVMPNDQMEKPDDDGLPSVQVDKGALKQPFEKTDLDNRSSNALIVYVLIIFSIVVIFYFLLLKRRK